MSIIIDLIILAIIVLTVIISAKRGFVRTLIELVGFIAAVFISFTISTPLANTTYDKIIEPSILSSVSSTADTAVDSSATGTLDDFWEQIPEWVKGSFEKSGITKDSLDQIISDNVGKGVQSVVETASENVIKPAVINTLKLIYQAVLLIVLMALVKPVAKLVNKLFSFSVIGTANRILGGVVGVPKGIIYAIEICLLITLAVSFTKNGFWIFTKDALEGSIFFSFVNSLRLI